MTMEMTILKFWALLTFAVFCWSLTFRSVRKNQDLHKENHLTPNMDAEELLNF